LVPGPTGRFLAFWTAFARAGFAFITSPELIALSAGEAIAPRRNIPKAARRFIWRLAVFYGLGSFCIGVIVPSDDPRLLSPESNANASPFVIGIQRAGIRGLDHAINAAILTSMEMMNLLLGDFTDNEQVHGLLAMLSSSPDRASCTQWPETIKRQPYSHVRLDSVYPTSPFSPPGLSAAWLI
jgi:amino acid transporter